VNFSVWPAHSASAASLGIELAANTAEALVKPYWKGNPDAVVSPGTTLHRPPYADVLDVECELVCIVGVGGRDLDHAAASRAIVGYSIMNDVSARERQSAEMKFGRGPSKGKDFDNGYPLGPWIVTADELGDPKELRMSLFVNGVERSACDTSGMIWDFAEMLSYLSSGQTVHPGSVISGGCYPGGSAHEVGIHLQPGDQVEMRISKIGGLVNTIGP
jgi:2-keto-4-pentenoate hydratase/2-oxohepta-3-ene-1,7-dioic acid hydratase in catechol pathway